MILSQPELTDEQKMLVERINALHEKWFILTKERIKTLPDGKEKTNLTQWVIDNENIRNN